MRVNYYSIVVASVLFLLLLIPDVFAYDRDSFIYSLSEPLAAAGGVAISEEEYCSRQVRNYEACVLPGGCWYVETPRKGTDLIDYFKSLNTTNEYIYVLMQFEGCFGTPTEEQRKTLNDDGIALFDFYGDYTYYAKVPRNILETKSYDFVRWIGPINTSLKIEPVLMNKLKATNEGFFFLNVVTYEDVNISERVQIIALSTKISPYSTSKSFTIESNKENVYALSTLPYVKRIQEIYIGGKELDRSSYKVSSDFVIGLEGNDASGITVGIPDEGFQLNHSHFSGITIFNGKNWVNNTNDVSAVCAESNCSDGIDNDNDGEIDQGSHGTHVASVVSGIGTFTGRTLKGISNNANLLLSRVFGQQFRRKGCCYYKVCR